MMYDLAIIGGGPAGFFAAEYGNSRGLKSVLFERDMLGGVCINEGCIPAKTLLNSVESFNIVKNARKYGISIEGSVGLDMQLALERKERVVKKMRSVINAKFDEETATIVHGQGYIVGRQGGGDFEIRCNETSYTARYLLICTGSRPDVPAIDGIDSPAVCTYDAMFHSTEIPPKIVMIGGGSVNIELAHIYNTLGSEIVILEETAEILPDTDNEISAMLRNEYAKRGIITYLNANIQRIDDRKVIFTSNGIEMEVEGDRILCDIGRRPNLEGFGLENLDVECYRKGIRINNQMQTSEPKVFAAGDVTGFSKSAHAAYCESAVVINTILGIADQMNFKAVSNCIFSNPQIAHVGVTEESLKLAWMPHKIVRLPFNQSSRYVIQEEEFDGMCKMIIGEDETILGVHMIGNHCIESILAAVMAVESRMKIAEWRKIVFPYPTIGEIMKGALIYSQFPKTSLK